MPKCPQVEIMELKARVKELEAEVARLEDVIINYDDQLVAVTMNNINEELCTEGCNPTPVYCPLCRLAELLAALERKQRGEKGGK